MIKMLSVILGGGVGSRLYPLTKDRSKPAVPIGGKYRLIDIPISNCLNSGVRRMFVLTQYNSASLNQHIANTYHFDIFSNGFVNLMAAEQTPSSNEWFQGTADAVRQIMHHLDAHDYDYVLILSGDQLYQMDFEELAKYHISQKAQLTIATIPVNDRDAPGFGIMKVDEKGMVNNFVEKPAKEELGNWMSDVEDKYKRENKHYLASMGIYIFNKELLKKLFADYPKATDFGKEFIPHCIQDENTTVASYAFGDYWTDIGTIRSFFEANIELTDTIPKFNLFDNQKIVYTRGRMLPPSKVFGTRFFKAVVAEGCIIHAEKIETSVIGLRSRIGEATVITNAVVMGNDKFQSLEEMMNDTIGSQLGIGKYCVIDHAIIDKDASIGDHCIIKGNINMKDEETENYTVRDGIVIVKKGAVLPAGTRIGM